MDTYYYRLGEFLGSLVLLVVGYALLRAGLDRRRATGNREGTRRLVAGIVVLGWMVLSIAVSSLT